MGRVCRQPIRELRQYCLGHRWGYGPNPCKVQSGGDGRWDPFERHSPSVHRTQWPGGHGCDAMVGAAWLNINSTYTNGIDYQQAIAAYNISPTKPFFLIESLYENDQLRTPSCSEPNPIGRSSTADSVIFLETVLSGGLGLQAQLPCFDGLASATGQPGCFGYAAFSGSV